MAAAQAVVREHQEHHLQVFYFFIVRIFLFEYITLVKKKIKWPRPRQ